MSDEADLSGHNTAVYDVETKTLHVSTVPNKR